MTQTIIITVVLTSAMGSDAGASEIGSASEVQSIDLSTRVADLELLFVVQSLGESGTCSSTLIQPQKVLAAAHCVIRFNLSPLV